MKKNLSDLHRRVLLARTSSGVVRRAYWVKDSEVPSHRMATNQQTAGVAPSQRVSVSYGMLFSKRANAEVDHAIHAIGKTHLVPGNIHNIKANVVGMLDSAHAEYHPVGDTFTRESLIKVSKYSSWPASSMVHEYGHYLDHHLFGDGKNRWTSFGSSGRRAADGYLEPTKEMSPLMNKLYSSGAGKRLIANLKHQMEHGDTDGIAISRYFLSPQEMVARGYAQWIGRRSSPLIHGQIHEMRKLYAEYGYHAQWEDKDFAPIAREFDRLFRNRRLLIKRGER